MSKFQEILKSLKRLPGVNVLDLWNFSTHFLKENDFTSEPSERFLGHQQYILSLLTSSMYLHYFKNTFG